MKVLGFHLEERRNWQGVDVLPCNCAKRKRRVVPLFTVQKCKNHTKFYTHKCTNTHVSVGTHTNAANVCRVPTYESVCDCMYKMGVVVE